MSSEIKQTRTNIGQNFNPPESPSKTNSTFKGWKMDGGQIYTADLLKGMKVSLAEHNFVALWEENLGCVELEHPSYGKPNKVRIVQIKPYVLNSLYAPLNIITENIEYLPDLELYDSIRYSLYRDTYYIGDEYKVCDLKITFSTDSSNIIINPKTGKISFSNYDSIQNGTTLGKVYITVSYESDTVPYTEEVFTVTLTKNKVKSLTGKTGYMFPNNTAFVYNSYIYMNYGTDVWEILNLDEYSNTVSALNLIYTATFEDDSKKEFRIQGFYNPYFPYDSWSAYRSSADNIHPNNKAFTQHYKETYHYYSDHARLIDENTGKWEWYDGILGENRDQRIIGVEGTFTFRYGGLSADVVDTEYAYGLGKRVLAVKYVGSHELLSSYLAANLPDMSTYHVDVTFTPSDITDVKGYLPSGISQDLVDDMNSRLPFYDVSIKITNNETGNIVMNDSAWSAGIESYVWPGLSWSYSVLPLMFKPTGGAGGSGETISMTGNASFDVGPIETFREGAKDPAGYGGTPAATGLWFEFGSSRIATRYEYVD